MKEYKRNGKTLLVDENELISSKQLLYLEEISRSYLQAMKQDGFNMVRIPGKKCHYTTLAAYQNFHRQKPHFRKAGTLRDT